MKETSMCVHLGTKQCSCCLWWPEHLSSSQIVTLFRIFDFKFWQILEAVNYCEFKPGLFGFHPRNWKETAHDVSNAETAATPALSPVRFQYEYAVVLSASTVAEHGRKSLEMLTAEMLSKYLEGRCQPSQVEICSTVQENWIPKGLDKARKFS